MFRKCDVHAGTKHRCRREGHLVGKAVMQGFSVPIYMCNQHADEYEKYGQVRILRKFTALFDEREWLEPWAQDGRPIEAVEDTTTTVVDHATAAEDTTTGDISETLVFGDKAFLGHDYTIGIDLPGLLVVDDEEPEDKE